MSDNMIPTTVLDSFGLPHTSCQELSGGSRPVYRVGNVVLKKLYATSLESEHSLELVPWLQEHLASVRENGFRIARPIPASSMRWVVEDGWSAVTFLEGAPAKSIDIPGVIEAAKAMFQAVRPLPKHPLFARNTTPWGVAHQACLRSDLPGRVNPRLRSLVEEHYARLEPVELRPFQVIHGDLNLSNVLISPDEAPGFLDFTPFWAPPELGLAILAMWAGPRMGDAQALRHFEELPNFRQMLLRASIRMLMVVSEFDGVQSWERAPEKRAAEIVLDYTK